MGDIGIDTGKEIIVEPLRETPPAREPATPTPVEPEKVPA